MDSDNESYHSESEFYYPDEENVLKENKTFRNTSNRKLFLKQSRRKNKHAICRPWSVRIGKNCVQEFCGFLQCFLEVGRGPQTAICCLE